MSKGRFEAFSDGVLAIIITIMVLELKVPRGESLDALWPLWPVFLSYALSFIYVGIYWNNHHHMLQATRKVTGAMLWANLHLLFWLSLLPFATGWVGQNGLAPVPTAIYGGILLMAALAYVILQRAIIAAEGERSILGKAVGSDLKGKISLALYLVAVACAPWFPGASQGCYISVAVIWLVPDRRIERVLADRQPGQC